MLDSKGFDLWADGYDKSVRLSEEENTYPFAGYKRVLGSIYNTIRSGEGTRVLDVGFGTGILAKRLYDEGYSITGIDFSERMIAAAREKMPEARLIRHDFSQGLPDSLKDRTFDFIVCTYAIHHLEQQQKIAFIAELTEHLTAAGKLLVGDIAFSTDAELEQCRAQSGDDWDEEESYPVVENLKLAFPQLAFEKISFCSGVLLFGKKSPA